MSQNTLEQSPSETYGTMYGIMYGMKKTTVYLSNELKRLIEQTAGDKGISEAEVIRESLKQALGNQRVRPRGGIIAGKESLSERVDELLAEGFGED